MSLSSETTNQRATSRGKVSLHNSPAPTNKSSPGVPRFLQGKPEVSEKKIGNNPFEGMGKAIDHSRHRGSTLPRHSREKFENGLGTDFSNVRIHDGPQHHQLARSLNAKAFTTGSDIYFGEGRYRPGTRDGDRLLAHELTHVAQQSSETVQAKSLEPGLAMGESGDRYEQDADRVADELVSDRLTTPRYTRNGIYSMPPASSSNSSTVIQRDDEDEQGFDYNLLPPSLAYRNGAFGMSADTSAAQLSYFSDEGQASLGYQYGGDIFYDARLGGFRSRFGVNPGSGVGSMSFGGSHQGFNFGTGANTAGNFNLSLGYGSPLLPMPYMLDQQADAAWQGAYALGGAMPGFMSDPIGTYGAQGDNIGAIGTFGGSMADIYGQQGNGGLPFGAGINISYNPEQQWVFGAGVQGSF
jgi:hypothetical protein